MRLQNIFRFGDKTVLAGLLETNQKVIAKTLAIVEVKGEEIARVFIEGELLSNTPHRDLWTKSPLNLDQEFVASHDVWLVSPPPPK